MGGPDAGDQRGLELQHDVEPRRRGTGRENWEIDWAFRRGLVQIRLVNDLAQDHLMHYLFTFTGRAVPHRARDDVVESNLAWKGTVLVRSGETVDILLVSPTPGCGWALPHRRAQPGRDGRIRFRREPDRIPTRPEQELKQRPWILAVDHDAGTRGLLAEGPPRPLRPSLRSGRRGIERRGVHLPGATLQKLSVALVLADRAGDGARLLTATRSLVTPPPTCPVDRMERAPLGV